MFGFGKLEKAVAEAKKTYSFVLTMMWANNPERGFGQPANSNDIKKMFYEVAEDPFLIGVFTALSMNCFGQHFGRGPTPDEVTKVTARTLNDYLNSIQVSDSILGSFQHYWRIGGNEFYEGSLAGNRFYGLMFGVDKIPDKREQIELAIKFQPEYAREMSNYFPNENRGSLAEAYFQLFIGEPYRRKRYPDEELKMSAAT